MANDPGPASVSPAERPDDSMTQSLYHRSGEGVPEPLGVEPALSRDPVVSLADTIRRDELAERLRGLARAGMPHTHGLVNSFDPECSPDRWCARCDFDAALAALLALGERDKAERERDRRQIARLTEAYCDQKMWQETRLDSGGDVWVFLCASDCDEPWDASAVLAVEEDARAMSTFVIDCAHYSEDMREDNAGFLTATCSCGWLCPPCPDEETRTDALMQHAYEAGILTARAAGEGDTE